MRAESRQLGPNARPSNQDWAEMRRTNRRPTAPQSFQRPPDPGSESNSSWWPVFWLLCLVTVTGLMVYRQYSTAPITSFDPSTVRQQTTEMLPAWLGGRFRNGGDEPVVPQTDSTALNAEKRLFFFPAADESGTIDVSKNDTAKNDTVRNRWPFSGLGAMVSGLFGAWEFSAADEQLTDSSGQEAGLRLVVEDDFREPLVSLASSAEAGRWMMDFLPSDQAEAGIYRMRVWHDTIAWTSIGEIPPPAQFRLDVTMQINPIVPEGYGGFLARYRDEQNYYLFLFDGEGYYRAMLRKDGQWASSPDWVNKAAINLAGQVNEIALEEREDVLRLYVNGALIDELKPVHPSGHIGLVAGSKTAKTIEVDYYRLALYELY